MSSGGAQNDVPPVLPEVQQHLAPPPGDGDDGDGDPLDDRGKTLLSADHLQEKVRS